MSIILPGVHTMISAPRFSSAIWQMNGRRRIVSAANIAVFLCGFFLVDPAFYLFADPRAPVDADHPESQRLGELLALFGDLQGQLSGGRHDHS